MKRTENLWDWVAWYEIHKELIKIMLIKINNTRTQELNELCFALTLSCTT